MIIELGKVTEETKNNSPTGAIDALGGKFD